MTADQFRLSEAEARQEGTAVFCYDCGEQLEPCDAKQCDKCMDYFCATCFGKDADLCTTCYKQDKEEEEDED